MRTLILSCNTGEGHNSCGKAIQQEMLASGIPCEMEDAFRFISPGFSAFVTFGFVRIYRYLPGLFRFGYRYSEKHPGVFKPSSGIYRLLTAGAERLYRYIKENEYDTVICTHVFSALIVSEILRRHALALQTCFVATDYTCSPSCEQSALDAYFIPDASLSEEFVRCGVAAEKIIASGLPIRRDFLHILPHAEAKKRVGLAPQDKHLVIMCGSMGCGPIRKVVRNIAPILPDGCYVSVLCGTNQRLKKAIDREHTGESRIRTYGYIDDVSAMLDSADLYLTKPGGISVTEATSKRLPMLFVDAVAGCEAYNMRFFTERGVAATAGSPADLAKKAVSLLENETSLLKMRERFPEPPPVTAAEVISRYMSCGQPRDAAEKEPAPCV